MKIQNHGAPRAACGARTRTRSLHAHVHVLAPMAQVSVLPVVSGVVEEALMRWLRAAELTCDRAALLVAQDSKVGQGCVSGWRGAGGARGEGGEVVLSLLQQQLRGWPDCPMGPWVRSEPC